MYAIIEDRGTQIKVAPGDVLDIDLLPGEEPEEAVAERKGKKKTARKAQASQKLSFDRVLLVGDADSGEAATIGTPYLDGATVEAEVLEEVRGDKLDVIMYKRRKGQRRKKGHRQSYLRVKITKINA